MGTRVALCASVVLGLISSAQATTTNLLTNGGVEKGAGTFNAQGYLTLTPTKNQTAITGWTITSGTVDIVSSKYWKPSQGSASIDMIGTNGLGAISQTVSTTANTSYNFTFDLSANPDAGKLGEASDTKRLLVQAFAADGTTVLASQTFTITNVGGTCPLSFEVLDSVQWLSSNPVADTLDPSQTATITVTAAPSAMQPGEYHTTLRVVCNAPGSPFLISVDLNVLHVDQIPGGLPTEYALHANYPNPFNPTTLLPFDVPQQSQVDIIVYNVMGQEVSRPVSGKYAAGRYQVTFDAGALPSGVYLVKMKAGNFTSVGKMMLLK